MSVCDAGREALHQLIDAISWVERYLDRLLMGYQ